MRNIHTDLAVEAREIYNEESNGNPQGVDFKEYK
ncbi:MAG TPA: GPR endopeptidase, partial [Clostridium sp.]|nr:GPR endopeptidase [Clostridium sp.]